MGVFVSYPKGTANEIKEKYPRLGILLYPLRN